MIPVARTISVYLVLGFQDEDRVLDENLGHVLAYDPATNTYASPGLTVEMCNKLENFYLRDGNFCYPKWEGFRRVKYKGLAASYRQFLSEAYDGDSECQSRK